MTDTKIVLWRWVGLQCSVLVALAGVVIARGFIPFGDFGLAALAIGDVFSVRTPTTGMPSTAWWTVPGSDLRHPGPLHFQLLAPVYLATGRSPWGLVFSSAIFAAAMLIAMLVLAWRIAGPLGVRLVGFSSMIWLLPSMTMVAPWNPVATVLGTGLALVSAWGVLTRQQWVWPWLVFAFSLTIQSHLGAPIVMAVIAAYVLFAAIRDARKHGNPWTFTEILVAMLVGLVCWAAPLWGVISAPRNNLTELMAWVSAGRDNSGASNNIGIVAYVLLALVFAIVVVVVLTRKTLYSYEGKTAVSLRRLTDLYLAAIAGVIVTLVVAGFGTAQFLFYATPIFIFPFVTAGFVGSFRRGRSASEARVPRWLVALVVIGPMSFWMYFYPESWLAAARYSDHVQLSTEKVLELEGTRDRPVVVSYPGYRWNPVAPAIAAELAANGIDVRIPNREEPIRSDPLWWRETPVEGPHLR
ncbi:MAG: hypothetical protein GX678_08220, partial [Actinomycetales bacterium]|nr:hypothetical protein [Actinomycetales bacterium]